MAKEKPPAFGRGRAAKLLRCGVIDIEQNQPDGQAEKRRERKLRRQLGEILTVAAEAGFRATFSLEKIEPPQNDNNKNEWDEVLEK